MAEGEGGKSNYDLCSMEPKSRWTKTEQQLNDGTSSSANGKKMKLLNIFQSFLFFAI